MMAELALTKPRTRRAPSPRRGEGRGEGARIARSGKTLSPSPGAPSAPTSPRWGEVERVALRAHEFSSVCGEGQQ